MAYSRRSKYSKRRSYKKSASVQRQLKSIRRSMKKHREYLHLAKTAAQTNITAEFLSVPICDFNSQGFCFGTTSEDLTDKTVHFLKSDIDCYVSLANAVNDEENTVNFNCFIVSLRDEAAPSMNVQTGAINISQATNAYTYVNGIVKLNPDMFKIHKSKRFTLTNYGSTLNTPAAQTQYGTDYRWNWKIRPNCKLVNPGGNWKSLLSGNDPSKTYYLLIFNDNSSVDLESPALTFNMHNTFYKLV